MRCGSTSVRVSYRGLMTALRRLPPRRAAVTVALLGPVLALTGCSTDEIGSRAAEVRSSAAAVGDAARNLPTKQACQAVRDDLGKVRSLAARLADDPSLGSQLAPQVTAAIRRLTDKLATSSAEWRAVLDATNGLGEALRAASEANVRLTASEVVLAVKVAEAGCAVVSR
jgi:hypothetical protein